MFAARSHRQAQASRNEYAIPTTVATRVAPQTTNEAKLEFGHPRGKGDLSWGVVSVRGRVARGTSTQANLPASLGVGVERESERGHAWVSVRVAWERIKRGLGAAPPERPTHIMASLAGHTHLPRDHHYERGEGNQEGESCPVEAAASLRAEDSSLGPSLKLTTA